ncbi:PTS sugar transporter subunit IIA [Listeria monocytogenes]|nr:PTS sugar transporter subunit IIA [Listeria monocytogenes]
MPKPSSIPVEVSSSRLYKSRINFFGFVIEPSSPSTSATFSNNNCFV